MERKREAGRGRRDKYLYRREADQARMRGKGECKARNSAGQWAGVEAGKGQGKANKS